MSDLHVGLGRDAYGEILDIAARQVATAGNRVASQPFSGKQGAERAIREYWQLLAAVHAHVWQLAGPAHRIAGLAVSEAAAAHDRVMVEFLDTVGPILRAHHVGSPSVPHIDADSMWGAATMSVNAATDLLRTHYTSDGAARTPDVELILQDSVFRIAAGRRVAEMTLTVLAAERDLSLRAGQAGMRWDLVARRLPDVGELHRIGQALQTWAPQAPDWTVLDVPAALAEARPVMRTGDPVAELGDRLLVVKQAAWDLTRRPAPGVGTLADIAAAAVTIHTHAAAHLRRDRSGAVVPLAPPTSRRLEEATVAWRLVHLRLRQVRTATPRSGQVRAQVTAIRALCAHLVPLERAVVTHDSQTHQRLKAVLNGSTETFAQIAAWNAHTMSNLAAAGQLYTPGRYLNADAVTDDPDLVELKLRDLPALLPEPDLQQITAAYTAAIRVRSDGHSLQSTYVEAPGLMPGRTR